MPHIELKNVSKYVLKNINLTIENKELLALVGPNGSGKSTLLNVVAGLMDYEGEVLFDGKEIDAIPSHKRGVGYLFQDLALFLSADQTLRISFLQFGNVEGIHELSHPLPDGSLGITLYFETIGNV